MNKILITGYGGFVGGHLAPEILKRFPGAAVVGAGKKAGNNPDPSVYFEECNFLDFVNVYEILDKHKPDFIFHLSAESSVASSWHNPSNMITNNVNSQLNLFEALRKIGLSKCRVIIAGSSEEYGDVAESDLPVTEECSLKPLSSYAVSKIGQDLLAYQYFRSYSMDVVRVRCFNLAGPGQASRYVLSSFARQIAEIEHGLNPSNVISVGNLNVVRDYMDVRDAVNYYIDIALNGKTGEVYNLCHGMPHELNELVKMMIAISGTNIELRPDASKMRPSDIKTIYGDNSKLKKISDYQPRYHIEQTLRDLLEYWRLAVKNRN